jgi:hypothetical protein
LDQGNYLESSSLEPDQSFAVGRRALREDEDLPPASSGFLSGFDLGLRVKLGPGVRGVVRAVAGASLDLVPDVLTGICLTTVDK